LRFIIQKRGFTKLKNELHIKIDILEKEKKDVQPKCEGLKIWFWSFRKEKKFRQIVRLSNDVI